MRWRALLSILLVLAGASLLGCGRWGDDVPERQPARTTEQPERVDHLCWLLEVPLKSMGRAHVTFADLVADLPDDDHGVGAMIWLGVAFRPGQLGRFEPVVMFLAERGQAGSDETAGREARYPTLTPEVAENARALDRELAEGRCG